MGGGIPRQISRVLPWALCVGVMICALAAPQAAIASEAVPGYAPMAAPNFFPVPVPVRASAPAAAVLTVLPQPLPVPRAKPAYVAPVAPTAAVLSAASYGMSEAPRGDALLERVMLDAHNDERAALGLPLLAWDTALAVDAGRYAAEMAQTGVYHHSQKSTRAIPSGENLWMGPRRLYGYEVMVGAFLEERKIFRNDAKLPDFSTTGYWQDVAHYTQMIWRGTQKVGCAVGDGAHYEYLVCRYFPAGNAYGKGPFDADEMMLPAPISAQPARLAVNGSGTR